MKADIPSGNIDFDDPMIAEQTPILFKNTMYYGFQGLRNFGRNRKPKNTFVTESIDRINIYQSKHISPIWVSWSFIIVPCTAMSYFLWTASKYETFNNMQKSLTLFMDKSLFSISTPSVPIHAYYSQFIESNVCRNYLNINNLCKLSSIGLSVINSLFFITCSAINYLSPTPKQPQCQSKGIKNPLYPYYKTIELQKYGKNIWISQMPFIFQGMQFGIRMVVILLDDEKKNVLIYSPIRLTKTTLDKIQNEYQWNVEYLIAPNSIHHLFLKEWIDQFPDCTVIAPPNLKERRKDIEFHHVLDIDVNDSSWNVMDIPSELQTTYSNIIEFMVIKTGIFHEEIVIFHKSSKTLILADNIENMGHEPETSSCKHFPIVAKIILRLAGMYQRPSAPTDMKLSVNHNWYRKSIQQVLSWDFNKIIPSHGRIIDNDARDVYIAANAFVL